MTKKREGLFYFPFNVHCIFLNHGLVHAIAVSALIKSRLDEHFCLKLTACLSLSHFTLQSLDQQTTVKPVNASDLVASSTTKPLRSYPAVPASSFNPADPSSTSSSSLSTLTKMVPTSTWGVGAALSSIAMTCCFSICLAIRRCRKRGKGMQVLLLFIILINILFGTY